MKNLPRATPSRNLFRSIRGKGGRAARLSRAAEIAPHLQHRRLALGAGPSALHPVDCFPLHRRRLTADADIRRLVEQLRRDGLVHISRRSSQTFVSLAA